MKLREPREQRETERKSESRKEPVPSRQTDRQGVGAELESNPKTWEGTGEGRLGS